MLTYVLLCISSFIVVFFLAISCKFVLLGLINCIYPYNQIISSNPIISPSGVHCLT